MLAALNVLCWLLNCDTCETFAKTLAELQDGLLERGIMIDVRPPQPPNEKGD